MRDRLALAFWDRLEAGSLATATLVLPLIVLRILLRGTQQDTHRRFRREDRGLRHFGGEQTDLL